MKQLLTVLIVIHVTAGIGALVSGAIAIALKKQMPRHKPVGRFYFWCMTVIFATGIFLSVVKGLLFFFFIAIFSYYATLIAYRSLRLKHLHEGQKPLTADWLIQGIAAITFLGMVILGVYSYYRNNAPGGVIPVAFGLLGLIGVYRNTMRFIKGPKETNYWLKIHVGNMLGSYIGAITAFIVNQSEHIPLNPIILWLGPTAILFPVIVTELKKVKSEPLKGR